MNTNEHQPTPEEIEVYNAAIMEGLQNRVILVADEASIAAKIGTIRRLGEDGKIPREVIFDMQKRGDFEQMEVAALKSQTPKQHPVKVGEWVKASNGAVSQVLEVHKDWYLIARGHGWTFANCEPYDPPATHDTEQGKAAAESAVRTEPVAEEIKVGDVVEVVSNTGRNTWLTDVGSVGTVTSIETLEDSLSVRLKAVPDKKNVCGGYVSICDVRKVTT